MPGHNNLTLPETSYGFKFLNYNISYKTTQHKHQVSECYPT